MEIVIPERPELPVAFAAQELRRYVKEMSGAELPVVQVPSKKPAIVLVIRPLTQGRQLLEDPREKDHYRLTVEARRLQIEGRKSLCPLRLCGGNGTRKAALAARASLVTLAPSCRGKS